MMMMMMLTYSDFMLLFLVYIGTRIRWPWRRKRTSWRTELVRFCRTTTTVRRRVVSEWSSTSAVSATRHNCARWRAFPTRCLVIRLNVVCTGTDRDTSSSSTDIDPRFRRATSDVIIVVAVIIIIFYYIICRSVVRYSCMACSCVSYVRGGRTRTRMFKCDGRLSAVADIR